MMNGPEAMACHDVRQYEGKGRHYPMKLLPESSKKKTKRTESALWGQSTSLRWPTQEPEKTDPPLGPFLSLNLTPHLPLYHLMPGLT